MIDRVYAVLDLFLPLRNTQWRAQVLEVEKLFEVPPRRGVPLEERVSALEALLARPARLQRAQWRQLGVLVANDADEDVSLLLCDAFPASAQEAQRVYSEVMEILDHMQYPVAFTLMGRLPLLRVKNDSDGRRAFADDWYVQAQSVEGYVRRKWGKSAAV